MGLEFVGSGGFLANSLRRVVRRWVCQGWDFKEARERGVVVSIVQVRTERAKGNQRLSCL